MARAASIMRSALRTTSSRAFRWSRFQDTYAVMAKPSANTRSSTRLNFSLRPMHSSSLAFLQPRVGLREADQADDGGVRARRGPRRPEPELHARAQPALELLHERVVPRLEDGGARVGEAVHRD